jgi:fucose permease
MTATRQVRSLAVAFAALGGTAAVIPAVIPAMADTLGTASVALLPAVPVLFFGLLAGVLATPLITIRLPLGTVLIVGALGQAGGLAIAAAAATPTWFMVGAGMAGIGFGFVEAGGTAAVRMHSAHGAPRLLTRLTVFIAIVATLTPVIVLAAAAAGHARLVPAAVAVVHVVAAVALRGTHREPSDADAIAPSPKPNTLRHTGFLAGALFCYVGLETTISGWSATTVEQQLGTTAALAALGTSAFWLLMGLGRIAGTVLIDARGAGRTALACTTGIALALVTAAATAALDPLVPLVLLAAAVILSGPCYALLLGVAVSRIRPAYAVSASSSLVAVGAAGGALIPLAATGAAPTLGHVAPTTIAALAATLMLLFFLAARGWRHRSVDLAVSPPVVGRAGEGAS